LQSFGESPNSQSLIGDKIRKLAAKSNDEDEKAKSFAKANIPNGCFYPYLGLIYALGENPLD
jgi:hypothetical protein